MAGFVSKMAVRKWHINSDLVSSRSKLVLAPPNAVQQIAPNQSELMFLRADGMRIKSELSLPLLLLADVCDSSPSFEETALPRIRHNREIELAALTSEVSVRTESCLPPHGFDLVSSRDGGAYIAEIIFGPL